MKCHFCKLPASNNWAKKVPLCGHHNRQLFMEQKSWYGGQISSGERVLFNAIAHILRPNGRKRGNRRAS